MPFQRRLLTALLGLALPITLAAAAEAAPRHRSPAQVRTATFKPAPHKMRHRQVNAGSTHRVAQAHRHTNLRGS